MIFQEPGSPSWLLFFFGLPESRQAGAPQEGASPWGRRGGEDGSCTLEARNPTLPPAGSGPGRYGGISAESTPGPHLCDPLPRQVPKATPLRRHPDPGKGCRLRSFSKQQSTAVRLMVEFTCNGTGPSAILASVAASARRPLRMSSRRRRRYGHIAGFRR